MSTVLILEFPWSVEATGRISSGVRVVQAMNISGWTLRLVARVESSAAIWWDRPARVLAQTAHLLIFEFGGYLAWRVEGGALRCAWWEAVLG